MKNINSLYSILLAFACFRKLVKLLDRNQIAVMTVPNAFLDDEYNIISNLSSLVGYDIKVLRTVVISETSEETYRRKREITSATGASLQLFVYGMINGNQPVDVSRLTSDLEKQVVSVHKIRVLSLEDHLEGLEKCLIPGQHTALLAATITLAVLLFILITAIIVWFLLLWKNKQSYEKFSDANSLASGVNTEFSSKVEISSKPRLNIEELKRSERRLQELLDTPVPEIDILPQNNAINPIENGESSSVIPQETLVNITDDPKLPIVIQSIDKLKDNIDESAEDDEFGEITKTPRKSVVTFNENVEKIIHLEYGIDDSPELDSNEVYKL